MRPYQAAPKRQANRVITGLSIILSLGAPVTALDFMTGSSAAVAGIPLADHIRYCGRPGVALTARLICPITSRRQRPITPPGSPNGRRLVVPHRGISRRTFAGGLGGPILTLMVFFGGPSPRDGDALYSRRQGISRPTTADL